MNTAKTDLINEDWISAYNHFRLRLQERYGMDISIKQYFLLHTIEAKKIKALTKHKYVMSVNYMGREIFIVKKIKGSVQLQSAFDPRSRQLKKWLAEKVEENISREVEGV